MKFPADPSAFSSWFFGDRQFISKFGFLGRFHGEIQRPEGGDRGDRDLGSSFPQSLDYSDSWVRILFSF
ncbi:hypothetical protein JJD41_12070 [Oxynema sp. CENA135]|uniref:hypothetical protein n=1 Tax=Oxynema sp. CENA135 TaxID=984206 RepID=UPI00190B028D|nr:hypothetical protein [Oxynema sp. CENA135]MBK4730594.1 hypothetical protein [Oxynema sp. CENA135]